MCLTPKTLSITVQGNTSKLMSNLSAPTPTTTTTTSLCPASQPVKVINPHEYDWRLHRVYAQPLLKRDGCKSLFGRAALLPYLSTGLVLLTPYITLTRRAWLGRCAALRCAAPDHGAAGIPARGGFPPAHNPHRKATGLWPLDLLQWWRGSISHQPPDGSSIMTASASSPSCPQQPIGTHSPRSVIPVSYNETDHFYRTDQRAVMPEALSKLLFEWHLSGTFLFDHKAYLVYASLTFLSIIHLANSKDYFCNK